MSKLQTYGEQITKLNTEKKGYRDMLNKKKEEGQKVRSELNSTKMAACNSEEEVDQKIRDIEFQMQTMSLTLSEEKRKLQEIQALKKQRPKIAAQAAKMKHLEGKMEELNSTEIYGSIKEKMDHLTEKCNEVWTE